METEEEEDPEPVIPCDNPTSPYNPYIPSSGFDHNESNWEIPTADTSVEPQGWGTDVEMSSEPFRGDVEDSELSAEFYTLCREAMENHQNFRDGSEVEEDWQ